MKQFPFVEDQLTVVTNDEHGVGAVPKGHKISHYQFLLGRLTTDQFIDGKPGMEGLCLVTTTRIELENQREEAESRGFWLLEDDRADAMLRAVERGPYNMAFAITLTIFAEATKNMSAYKPAKKKLEAVEEPAAE